MAFAERITAIKTPRILDVEGFFFLGWCGMWQFLLGFIAAWVLCSGYTHTMIALECERLGSFFVGKKVYKCIEVKNPDEKK